MTGARRPTAPSHEQRARALLDGRAAFWEAVRAAVPGVRELDPAARLQFEDATRRALNAALPRPD